MLNLNVLEPFSNNYLNIGPVFLPDPEQDVMVRWSEEKEVGNQSMKPELNTVMSRKIKVLFLDIDETLAHCIDDRDPPTMKGEQKVKICLRD